jgi:hypothetical protein
MPTLQLTDEQVIELVRQLPVDRQRALIDVLLLEQWPEWADLSDKAQEGARLAAAERGRDWDAMSEEERETFVDEVVHEDR